MHIQYASDLHIEFPDNKAFLKSKPLNCNGDILILAGDIVPFHRLELHDDFFDYISDTFPQTYWIPGNHEYYHWDLASRSGTFSESIRSNITLLNNMSVIENDVKIIFSTLWSHIHDENRASVLSRLNDFRLITNHDERLTIEMFNDLHKESKEFVIGELQKNECSKTLVVTHHVPTYEKYPEKYRHSTINDAFTVDMNDVITKYQPQAWIYGHSHFNTKAFSMGKTQMLTNQLGYVVYDEQKGYKPKAMIEI